jgi:hypothetical protein
MFCSRSVSLHLLRGALAVALVILAMEYGGERIWLWPPAIVGAALLLRGCPMCWLVGLFETLASRRNAHSR